MCTNFVPATRLEISALRLGVIDLPPTQWPDEVFPGYSAPILRLGPRGSLECQLARFGLVPPWCRDETHGKEIARGTYNARSETAAEKPSFRGAWHKRQWALAPMQSFFEPCWEGAADQGGRAERWQMSLTDGGVFAVAGLWEAWKNPKDASVLQSFTLLTVNADGHAVMGRMHRPGDEKRMPVIIEPQRYAEWLNASPANAGQFMQCWPASSMAARAAPKRSAPAKPDPEGPTNLSLF